MSCPVCADRGIARIRYHSGDPDDFGVCLCAAGRPYRSERNGAGDLTPYGLWQVWAARAQVDPGRVFMIEELLDDAELAAIPRAGGAAAVIGTSSVTSITDAMRTTKRPRL